MRIALLIVVVVLACAAPLLVFGLGDEAEPGAQRVVNQLQAWGPWAWAAGSGLIIADLVLPVPAPAIMSGLGIIYGTLLGGLIGAAASIAAGLIAYGLTRLLGPRATRWFVGPDELVRAQRVFDRVGGVAVAASRPLPLLPEAIAALAGLMGMPLRTFFIALACGSLPSGLLYAGVGALAASRPILALVLMITLPIALWLVAQQLFTPRRAAPPSAG